MASNGSILPFLGGVLGAVTEMTRPRREYKWNKRAAEDANRMNQENAARQLAESRADAERARLYDSPAESMKRYLAAGLNPHLIYGGGSGSSGGAFPVMAPNIPAVNIQAPSPAMPNPIGQFIALSQGLASQGLTEAKTTESIEKTALIQAQTDIAKTNPMLSPTVAKAVSESMMETAKLKADQAGYIRQSWFDYRDKDGFNHSERIYVAQIHRELEETFQRLGLNTADLAIKNRILESKEFENAIKEIQANWLKDGNVTPQHIYQGLMLVLSKMMGK